MTPPSNACGQKKWRDLTSYDHFLLARKLKGLYEFSSDEEAFNSLAFDKQQALFILAKRLAAHDLWQHVRRVENVYGLGGVGLSFTAWPGLRVALDCHRSFRLSWAAPCCCCWRRRIAYREKKRCLAALHFSHAQQKLHSARNWSVHFDYYNPLYSPTAAWLHFFHEVFRQEPPSWQAIDKALREG